MKSLQTKEILHSDIFSHLPQMNYIPRWGVLLLDLFLCAIAFWISIWVGSDFLTNIDASREMLSFGWQCLIVLGVQVLTFWAFHTYSGILRYSTFIDTIKVFLANISAGVILMLVNLASDQIVGTHPILNSMLLIYMPFAFVMLFSLRVGVKTLYESLQRSQGSPRVMIYGTQAAGVAIAKMLRSAGNAPYHPVGFIADPSQKYGYDLAGLRVRLLNDSLFVWMRAHGIQHASRRLRCRRLTRPRTFRTSSIITSVSLPRRTSPNGIISTISICSASDVSRQYESKTCSSAPRSM